MQRKREARRDAAEKFRTERKIEDLRNTAEGRPGGVDFQRLVKRFRRNYIPSSAGQADSTTELLMSSSSRCKIFCRKRPVNDRERSERDYDVVSIFAAQENDTVIVHRPLKLVDGYESGYKIRVFSFTVHLMPRAQTSVCTAKCAVRSSKSACAMARQACCLQPDKLAAARPTRSKL